MRAARPVRGAAWGNGPGEIPAPRPRPTQPRDRHGHVLVDGEHGLQSGALAVGEQRKPGPQGAPDPVERVPGAAPVARRVLLDALAALVELPGGEVDDMEGVHHGDASGSWLVAAFL